MLQVAENSKPKKWNGIQVDGKPLSSYFEQQVEDQDKQTISEEITKKKKTKRRVYIKEKHQPQKERAGKMTTVPQRILNEQNLNGNLEKSKSFKEEIISYLLAGTKFTAVDLQAHYQKRGKRIAKQPIWNCLSNLMRTNFAQYIERKREKKNGNVQYRYWLSVEGLQLQPEGAFELSKHFIEGREPGNVKPKKKTPGPKTKAAQTTAITGVDKEMKKVEDEITKLKKGINALLTTAGLDHGPADLNVDVSGKIDVVFTLKVG